ncbi:hypothetical protein BC938DRAFT_476676 [Jimgerdemannia flammicorona]|uniref:Uncharacterized protein n=1 Tax=Jimgerdemannia flammicorona TaxID=994334 RepID=A0A433QZ61_9FUNG|nr:hypothetical protein BC938DRAFT_476676 [Jimgerdemannia flammicorona]
MTDAPPERTENFRNHASSSAAHVSPSDMGPDEENNQSPPAAHLEHLFDDFSEVLYKVQEEEGRDIRRSSLYQKKANTRPTDSHIAILAENRSVQTSSDEFATISENTTPNSTFSGYFEPGESSTSPEPKLKDKKYHDDLNNSLGGFARVLDPNFEGFTKTPKQRSYSKKGYGNLAVNTIEILREGLKKDAEINRLKPQNDNLNRSRRYEPRGRTASLAGIEVGEVHVNSARNRIGGVIRKLLHKRRHDKFELEEWQSEWDELMEAFIEVAPTPSRMEAVIEVAPTPSRMEAVIEVVPTPSGMEAFNEVAPTPSGMEEFIEVAPTPNSSRILRGDVDEQSVGNNNNFKNDPTFSKAKAAFYSWLEKQLEEEKEDAELIELHMLGNCIADIIDKDQLVMLVPIHLLDDMNWYTDELGIRLYVRWQLTEDQLQKLNEVIKNKGTLFKGVEQLIVVDVAASGVGGDNVDPSDSSNSEGHDADGHNRSVGQSDGENRLSQRSGAGSGQSPAKSSHKHEPNEGGSSSAGVGTLDLDGAVDANRPNTSGNNDEGVDGGGLSRPEASSSTESVIRNWRHLLGSFCECFHCCFSGVSRDHHIIEAEENSRPGFHAGDDPTTQYNEAMTPSIPPIFSNPTDETPQITVTSSIGSPDSTNERTAAGGLHSSTEENNTHSNTSTSMPNIMNHNRETNVSQGINAAGAIFQYSNVNVFNEICRRAPTPERSEDTKFFVSVYTSTIAVLEDKKQEFTIQFTLKITVSKSSHEFELSKIVLAGGLEHLIPNERYYFNNLLIEIAPCNAKTKYDQVQPVDENRGNWLTSLRTTSNAIRWCHKIDDPEKQAGVLRYKIETHRVKHEWEHFDREPTEYSIDLKVGLTFSRHRFYTGARLQNDYDLVNSVSIRVKNIREHHKVTKPPSVLLCTWELTKAKYVSRGLNSRDTSEAVVCRAHFAECAKCCTLAAGIGTIRKPPKLQDDKLPVP